MVKQSNESLKVPLLLAGGFTLAFFVFLVTFHQDDYRGSFDVERALSRMCTIRKSYNEGWLGNISTRKAVVQIWNARLYQEQKARLSQRKNHEEILEGIEVDNSGRTLVVSMGSLVGSMPQARALAQEYYDEIMRAVRSPAGFDENRQCFYLMNVELFDEIEIESDSVEFSKKLP